MIFEKTFRERLTILIGDSGVQLFSKRTGVSQDIIQKFLHAEALPNLKVLEQLAETNGVTVGWLIGEEQLPQKNDHLLTSCSDASMHDIYQWITEQNDSINYWEVIKAMLAKEYPEFKEWLKDKYNLK